jgi:signal transduction histidine kinase
LLASIAQQAGAAAQAVHLTANLRQSRQRIVVAREEERRRLRRDLHDGLGPQLATLALQIDAARNLIGQNPESAESLLRDLKRGTQDAIAEIRRVVHDLRPPALDQLGLVESLRHFAATMQTEALSITVTAPDKLPPLPAAVEVAAYRIAVEALTNVARHADAASCHVALALADGVLRLTVRDNGTGFSAESQPGVGWLSMRERAAELGGTLSIDTADGVTVEATLPLEIAR